MKRVHYLLLGLGLSLCIAAVGPGGGTIIPGGASNVALKNGTNVFTGTNTFSNVVMTGNILADSPNARSLGDSTNPFLNLWAARTRGSFINTTYLNNSADTATAFALGAVNVEFGAPLLQFNGTGATFPALKRSSTELQVRLADDSGYGNLAMRTLSTPSGANSRAGNATLVAGAVTVAVNSVSANTIAMITRKTSGGTPGMAITYTLNAGVGFTITSDNALDTSIVSYFLVENP